MVEVSKVLAARYVCNVQTEKNLVKLNMDFIVLVMFFHPSLKFLSSHHSAIEYCILSLNYFVQHWVQLCPG